MAALETFAPAEGESCVGKVGAMLIVLLTFAAVAVIPITIGYYLWLARSVGPHLVSLPIRLAITIFAVWVTLPWIALTAAVWLVWG